MQKMMITAETILEFAVENKTHWLNIVSVTKGE